MAPETGRIKITVDRTKCRFSLFDPSGCKRCMEICPVVLFGCVPKERKAGSAPTVYALTIVWEELCNGCGACVQVCPTRAITLEEYEAGESLPWSPLRRKQP